MPVELLAILQREIDETLKLVKAAKARFDGALTIRYATRAEELRHESGKDTGTVRFDDGDFTIVADLPKRVVWDQSKLAEMVERIRAAGDDPAEYVDISFKVPERKYSAWPEGIRKGFEPARTVRPGNLWTFAKVITGWRLWCRTIYTRTRSREPYTCSARNGRIG